MWIPSEDTKKTGQKIISVILAVLLWAYVVNQGSVTAGQNTVTVTIEYRNAGEGLSIKGPETVSVRLWGILRKDAPIKAYMDLSGLQEGSYDLPVVVEDPGAIFTSVQPNHAAVNLQGMQEHMMTITYQILHNPPDGYDLLDVVPIPEKCSIKGEEQAVNRVAAVIGQLDLSDIKDTQAIPTRLAAYDANGKPITGGFTIVPQQVSMYAVVAAKQTAREYPVAAVTQGQVAQDFRVAAIGSLPSTVLVMGNEELTRGINEVKTAPVVIDGKTSSFQEQTTLDLPAGLTAYPAVVTIQVTIVNKTTPGTTQ